ncbi:MAG: hypothetical protein QOF41_324 [Methylobacteriaceae bacterium]|nr:hypothetical protein [Methylobacteriaceae bacterium]
MVDKKTPKAGPDIAAPEKPLCFVIGPIGKPGTPTRNRSDFLLHGIIKYELEAEEFGYEVRRADEDARPGMIGDRVLHDVREAELVIADLSELNANAFYELAIRHLTEKPTIHMTNDITSLPFDNIGHAAIPYELSTWPGVLAARSALADSVRAAQKPGFRVSNPITQANALFKPKGSADPQSDLLIELRDKVSWLERSVHFFPTGGLGQTPTRRGLLAPDVSGLDVIRGMSLLLRGKKFRNSEELSSAAGHYILQRNAGMGNATYIGEGTDITLPLYTGGHVRILVPKYPVEGGDLEFALSTM